MRAIFHVSGHGFGHATRMAALAAELRRLSPGLRVTVRSDAPAHLFTREDPAIEVEAAALDPGVRQLDGLRADWPATLAAHEAFLAGWDAAAEREAVRLRELRAALLVGDIPPLAFEAAARAGVPSAGVSNFSWDWILADAAGGEPRWAPILARYRAAYARCGRLH
ncbi:MAG TPA: glycosyl transferase, partial [Elusimicrobiota bacterium]|nr:glycosyl transferase [Elusimicrobiota bacterium]